MAVDNGCYNYYCRWWCLVVLDDELWMVNTSHRLYQWTYDKSGYKGATMVSLPDCCSSSPATHGFVTRHGLLFDYLEADHGHSKFMDLQPLNQLNQGPTPEPWTIAAWDACVFVGSEVQHGSWLYDEGRISMWVCPKMMATTSFGAIPWYTIFGQTHKCTCVHMDILICIDCQEASRNRMPMGKGKQHIRMCKSDGNRYGGHNATLLHGV